FVKDGADFLRQAYDFKDIEADVTLEEWRYHPKTSHPYLHSTGTFDFSDYKSNKLEVKVPFKSGGLNSLIKSQLREKFELERLESINGKVINPIDKKTVALTSRKIYLISRFDYLETSNESIVHVESNAGNTRDKTVALPLNLKGKSHDQAQYVIQNSTGTELVGSTGLMFFLIADRTRTLNIDLNVAFDAIVEQHENVQWADYKICITTYQNGNAFDLKHREVLSNLSDNNEYPNQPFGDDYDIAFNQFTVPMAASYKDTVTLLAGESLALECLLKADMYTDNQAGVRVKNENITGGLTIEEDSFFDDSQTKAVLMKDAGDKLMQIITGKQNRFYSEFYESGTFAKLALTTGFWIRQFFDKNIELSLDDYLKTSDAVCATGYHIETRNGVEVLGVEDLKFYFQDATAIRLPYEVTDLEEEAAPEYCHSSLEFGYKKGGEYEEAMGLDEYNVKTGFTMPLKRPTTKFTKVSPTRADKYAQEFSRRKSVLTHPTTDTPYDKDNHLLDLKDGLGLALEERTWEDDFELLPTGVYSPETATNLRLTPSQIEQRHEWFYGCSLLKQQDEKIRYSNTGGNNNLVTKKVSETARGEKDDIVISTMRKARFEPKKVKFKHPVDFYVNEQLNGSTNVNGRLVPNVYFKVEYKYKGKLHTGYLLQLKPNNEGDWELLKAI
uniref:hypothetical protein n=1 Tax=uncultured Wocania sp. TaxID=2834404 RepID=UPI0030F56D38